MTLLNNIKMFILFQTTMISLEALPKVIDSSQLTPDLDGTLQYDHAQWIDLRLVSRLIFIRKLKIFDYRNCLCNVVNNGIALPTLCPHLRVLAIRHVRASHCQATMTSRASRW